VHAFIEDNFIDDTSGVIRQVTVAEALVLKAFFGTTVAGNIVSKLEGNITSSVARMRTKKAEAVATKFNYTTCTKESQSEFLACHTGGKCNVLVRLPKATTNGSKRATDTASQKLSLKKTSPTEVPMTPELKPPAIPLLVGKQTAEVTSTIVTYVQAYPIGSIVNVEAATAPGILPKHSNGLRQAEVVAFDENNGTYEVRPGAANVGKRKERTGVQEDWMQSACKFV
jgi:hypothetical protein